MTATTATIPDTERLAYATAAIRHLQTVASRGGNGEPDAAIRKIIQDAGFALERLSDVGSVDVERFQLSPPARDPEELSEQTALLVEVLDEVRGLRQEMKCLRGSATCDTEG